MAVISVLVPTRTPSSILMLWALPVTHPEAVAAEAELVAAIAEALELPAPAEAGMVKNVPAVAAGTAKNAQVAAASTGNLHTRHLAIRSREATAAIRAIKTATVPLAEGTPLVNAKARPSLTAAARNARVATVKNAALAMEKSVRAGTGRSAPADMVNNAPKLTARSALEAMDRSARVATTGRRLEEEATGKSRPLADMGETKSAAEAGTRAVALNSRKAREPKALSVTWRRMP